MKKRIFVAINLPEDVKDELAEISDDLAEIPVRWTKKENLHVTLCFIGDTDEGNLNEIYSNLENLFKDFSTFEIILHSITLGPSEYDPRMIWANGESSIGLDEMIRKMSAILRKYGCREADRKFRIHITLARANGDRISGYVPPLNKINVSFKVGKIDLMESELLPGGPNYKILKSFKLSNGN